MVWFPPILHGLPRRFVTVDQVKDLGPLLLDLVGLSEHKVKGPFEDHVEIDVLKWSHVQLPDQQVLEVLCDSKVDQEYRCLVSHLQ